MLDRSQVHCLLKYAALRIVVASRLWLTAAFSHRWPVETNRSSVSCHPKYPMRCCLKRDSFFLMLVPFLSLSVAGTILIAGILAKFSFG